MTCDCMTSLLSASRVQRMMGGGLPVMIATLPANRVWEKTWAMAPLIEKFRSLCPLLLLLLPPYPPAMSFELVTRSSCRRKEAALA